MASRARLTQEEARELVRRGQAGDRRAEAELVEGHMGLVKRIARRHLVPGGLGWDDLVQEGALGLLHAARKYDLGRQTKFSSYAAGWVIDKMQKAMRRQPIVSQEETEFSFGDNQSFSPATTERPLNNLAVDRKDGRDPAPDLSAVLAMLTRRERQALTLLYGLGGGRPLTEEEAAGVMGISQQRVSQLRNGAFERIRRWHLLPPDELEAA